MGFDRIDLPLTHRPDPLLNQHETGGALGEVIQSDKMLAVGVSDIRPCDLSLLQSAMQTRLALNQIELSLLAHQGFNVGQVASIQGRGLPIMAWSPLEDENLLTEGRHPLNAVFLNLGEQTGTDAAAVASAWPLAHPPRILPVMGTNNLDRIRAQSQDFGVRTDWQT